MDPFKFCKGCGETKPRTEFHQCKVVKRGKEYVQTNTYCKPCRSERRRNDPKEKERNRLANRARYATEDGRRRALEIQFRSRWGISYAERDAMLAAQGGGCAVCGSKDPGSAKGWATDHDHSCCPGATKTCGKCIRGILCNRCNLALGHVKDNPDTLRALIAYLESK